MINVRRWIAAFLLPIVLGGCMPRDVRRFEMLPPQTDAIEFAVAPPLYDRFDPRLVNGHVGRGAKGGMAGGAVVGAAIGLGCGPFFWLCSPVLAVAGGGGGAALGAGFSAIALAPDSEDGAALRRAVESVRYEEMVGAIVQDLRERGSGVWGKGEGKSAWNARVRIDDLAIRYQDRSVMLEVRGVVILKNAAGLHQEIDVEAWTPATNVEAWRDPAFAALQMRRVEKELAELIFSRLT